MRQPSRGPNADSSRMPGLYEQAEGKCALMLTFNARLPVECGVSFTTGEHGSLLFLIAGGNAFHQFVYSHYVVLDVTRAAWDEKPGSAKCHKSTECGFPFNYSYRTYHISHHHQTHRTSSRRVLLPPSERPILGNNCLAGTATFRSLMGRSYTRIRPDRSGRYLAANSLSVSSGSVVTNPRGGPRTTPLDAEPNSRKRLERRLRPAVAVSTLEAISATMAKTTSKSTTEPKRFRTAQSSRNRTPTNGGETPVVWSDCTAASRNSTPMFMSSPLATLGTYLIMKYSQLRPAFMGRNYNRDAEACGHFLAKKCRLDGCVEIVPLSQCGSRPVTLAA